MKFDFSKKTKRLQIKPLDAEIPIFNEMRDHFSEANPNAFFLKKKRPNAPSRYFAITPAGTCEPGLFFEIQKFLVKYEVSIHLTENLKEWIKAGFDDTVVHQNFTHELRDYQEEFVQKALKFGRGVCVVGTGSGKTLTMAALIENFYLRKNKNTFRALVIVPDPGLVDQTLKEFIAEGVSFDVTPWTGKHEIQDSNVIICNMSILQRRFKKPEYDWLKYVDLVIFDEGHKNRKGNSIGDIINKIITYNKYGFTGTLPSDNIDKWSVIGKLGPVIYEKSSYELRQENYLVNAEICCINLQYIDSTRRNYEDELAFLFSNVYRNTILKKLCTNIKTNTLILVNRLAHGEELYNCLSTISDKQVFYIKGDVEIEDRNEVKRLMEEHDNVICIAISKIFSTGINIKNLHNIIFAAGGKAFITIVQSIGRGLRLHENKNKLYIFDICDDLKYSIRHADKRKEIYQHEKINIVEKTIKESIIR